MTTKKATHSALVRDIDKAAARLIPLSNHYAASQDKHVREQYAVMLAAVLSTEEKVSETKTRLLEMLVQSLKLKISLASLFKQAQQLNTDSVFIALHLLKKQDIWLSFYLDAIIIMRLDAPISEAQEDLLSLFLQAFDAPDEVVSLLMYWATRILGLPVKIEIPIKKLTLLKARTTIDQSLKLLNVKDLLFDESDFVYKNKKILSMKFPPKENEGFIPTRVIERSLFGSHTASSLDDFLPLLFKSDSILIKWIVTEGDVIKNSTKIAYYLPVSDYTSVWREFLEIKP